MKVKTFNVSKINQNLSNKFRIEFDEAAKSQSSPDVSYSTNFSESSSIKTKSLATPKQTDVSEYSSDFDTTSETETEARSEVIKKIPTKAQIDPLKLLPLCSFHFKKVI